MTVVPGCVAFSRLGLMQWLLLGRNQDVRFSGCDDEPRATMPVLGQPTVWRTHPAVWQMYAESRSTRLEEAGIEVHAHRRRGAWAAASAACRAWLPARRCGGGLSGGYLN